MAHFEFSSVIPARREDVFKLVSDMSRLPEVMPKTYKIELTSPASKMKKGTEYEVRISRYGISVAWGVVIEDYSENEMFRDRQTHGPFALWVHTHKFEDHGQGTLMTDLIEYDLPFGLLGKLAQDIFIRRDLEKIFDSRHEKTRQLLQSIRA